MWRITQRALIIQTTEGKVKHSSAKDSSIYKQHCIIGGLFDCVDWKVLCILASFPGFHWAIFHCCFFFVHQPHRYLVFWGRFFQMFYKVIEGYSIVLHMLGVYFPGEIPHVILRPYWLLKSLQALRLWWRNQMETFSALLTLCAGNSPVTDEFPAQRPVTRSYDVFCDLCLNKRLSKQSWGWWFETPPRSLWHLCNAMNVCKLLKYDSWQPQFGKRQSPG